MKVVYKTTKNNQVISLLFLQHNFKVDQTCVISHDSAVKSKVISITYKGVAIHSFKQIR